MYSSWQYFKLGVQQKGWRETLKLPRPVARLHALVEAVSFLWLVTIAVKLSDPYGTKRIVGIDPAMTVLYCLCAMGLIAVMGVFLQIFLFIAIRQERHRNRMVLMNLLKFSNVFIPVLAGLMILTQGLPLAMLAVRMRGSKNLDTVMVLGKAYWITSAALLILLVIAIPVAFHTFCKDLHAFVQSQKSSFADEMQGVLFRLNTIRSRGMVAAFLFGVLMLVIGLYDLAMYYVTTYFVATMLFLGPVMFWYAAETTLRRGERFTARSSMSPTFVRDFMFSYAEDSGREGGGGGGGNGLSSGVPIIFRSSAEWVAKGILRRTLSPQNSERHAFWSDNPANEIQPIDRMGQKSSCAENFQNVTDLDVGTRRIDVLRDANSSSVGAMPSPLPSRDSIRPKANEEFANLVAKENNVPVLASSPSMLRLAKKKAMLQNLEKNNTQQQRLALVIRSSSSPNTNNSPRTRVESSFASLTSGRQADTCDSDVTTAGGGNSLATLSETSPNSSPNQVQGSITGVVVEPTDKFVLTTT